MDATRPESDACVDPEPLEDRLRRLIELGNRQRQALRTYQRELYLTLTFLQEKALPEALPQEATPALHAEGEDSGQGPQEGPGNRKKRRLGGETLGGCS